LEHPLGHARLLRRDADVVHMQWLAAPWLDERLLRLSRPSVLTAHDPLPRRAASRPQAWRRLVERFDRVVVHSDWGREELARLGVGRERIRLVPHPVFPSDPPRSDDGRTLLRLG